METIEVKRAIWRLEEERNIASSATQLAEADQEDFLPELPAKSLDELVSIARVYEVLPARGRVSKTALIALLTEKINARAEETRSLYDRLCSELEELQQSLTA